MLKERKNPMPQRLIWNFEFSAKKIPLLSDLVHEPTDFKWEIRFFWPEAQVISLYNIDDSLLSITNYKQKYREDCYYLLPNHHYNIKSRANKLLYKPLVKQTR